MIKSKKLDRVIVGGTDSLAKFTINGFNTLMLLSEKECMPFDANRNGLNLGEGAAYLVLESEEIINKGGKKVLANISGYANANDAFHQTGSSDKGNGAFIAINKAIKNWLSNGAANFNPVMIITIDARVTRIELDCWCKLLM